MLFDGTIPAEAKNKDLHILQSEEKVLNDWQKQRLGKITCSRFGLVKKLKNGAWSETALSYVYDLIGEHLTGQPSETFEGSKATAWGNEHEAAALKAYTKRTGRKTKPGHFLHDRECKLVGGTPDAFCGEKGLVEVKCPLTYKNHLRTVITRTVPDEYIDQVLGQMMLSGRDWCDFVSYDPRIKGRHGLVIVRVRRAENINRMEELAVRIIEFHELLMENLKKLACKPIVSHSKKRST